MKDKLSKATHKAVTTEELTIAFGVGRLKQEVVVPKGTRCHKLDGGSQPWVVDDLGFIADKKSILFHDADHYGIRVPEDKLTNITAL
mgnify:CR=1 FL=1